MKNQARVNRGNFFEDFQLGQVIKHSTPRTITDGDSSVYLSLTGSRHSLHSSRVLAQELGFPDRPIDDFLLFNIAFGKTVPEISLNAIANLGYAEVIFLSPVFSGDTINCESVVIGLKENSSCESGVLYIKSTCFNQTGNAVLSWIRWVMIKKRDRFSKIKTRYIPDLPEKTSIKSMVISSRIGNQECLGRVFEANGSSSTWESFVVGEKILHPSGMTIEESDHMLATRLYQNNAMPHFDARLMSNSKHGRRLVYGGHIISICRALSFDGLENCLSISAINAGKHLSPTFSGDTIYSFTEVLGKEKIFGRSDFAALRLKTTALKNITGSEFLDERMTEESKRSHMVLELDYTTIIPKSGSK